MDAIKVERVILALGGGAKLRMLLCKAMERSREGRYFISLHYNPD